MSECLIICNPTAGHGAAKRLLTEVDLILAELGLDYEIVQTEAPWHAADLAEAAARKGAATVVAMGGDGTANEVLNGLMRAQNAGADCPTLGILTVGRGNDMAYGWGIPQDVEASCQTLVSGLRRRVDVGHVVGGLYPDGRYFGNGIGIGFDTIVGFEAAKLKRLSGFAGYLVAALKTISLYYRAPLTTVQADGQTLTLPALMVSVMNGQRMGGGFMMAPDSLPDDGQLDLCVVRGVSRARMLPLIMRFMQGTQYGQAAVTGLRARTVTVTAVEGSLPAHADGETLCTDARELAITLLPQAIEILCQPADAGR